MTSQTDVKTNEILLRRKIRLQQVREQSKNIAKKIRERAYVGKLQFITNTDKAKEQEYRKHQDNLIHHLQAYYQKGVDNLGDGHRHACEVDNEEQSTKQLDKSKLRGKEAIAELRKKKQEVLDQHKKVLDRKLQAREEANEISREKLLSITNKLNIKHQIIKNSDKPNTNTVHEGNENDATNNNENGIANENSQNLTDMSTQWDLDAPSECEPSVPALTLINNGATQDINQLQPEKNKKMDLFALSDEMPASLRGGLTNTSEQTAFNKPSTLVSQYLQNRNLNLRDHGPTTGTKHANDLPKLRQTILRAHSTATEGLCVLDEQLIPVPVWHPVKHCSFCLNNNNKNTNAYIPVGNKRLTITNSELNKIYSSICSSHLQSSTNPNLVPQRASPAKSLATKVFSYPYNTNLCRQNKSIDHKLGEKQSVTVYNHSTKDSRVLPCEDKTLVVRDERSQEDAYSQASKMNSLSQLDDHNKQKVQTTRNRVAVSKLNVEKEYNETVGFLNTLQRHKSPKPVIRNAYKTEKQQKAHNSKHQQKLECEFNKIENECRRKQKCQKSSLSHRRSISRSPVKTNIRDDEEDNDFEYSWMPIPESDATLAIHTIPTAVKESRVGNNVKFSNVDGYHEYRSRHKHTPPTKDVGLEKQRHNVPKKIYLDDNESTSSITDSSSVDNTELPSARNHNDAHSNTLTDSEHIVIYKVLNQKKAKKDRKQKFINDIIKALRDEKDNDVSKKDDEHIDLKNFVKANTQQNKSFEQLKEGIYKTVTENGDSVTNCVVDPIENTLLNGQDAAAGPSRCISKTNTGACKHTQAQWDIENKTERTDVRCVACQCEQYHPKPQTSICTSDSTFKTATQVIANDIDMLNERFTKLIDDKEKESQKLYVGASGLFKDDAYEVVIQLRKKDSSNTQKDNIENVSDKKVSSSELYIEEHRPTETSKTTENRNIDDLMNIPDQITQNGAVLEPLPEQTIKDSIEHDKDVKKILSEKKCPTVEKADTTLLSENVLKPSDLKTAYTQTTFSSPNPKSTLNQMSSSASTSYMSPPESLLPRYLRNKHCSDDQERQQSLEVQETPNSYPSNQKNCVCRKCRHTRKKVHSENQTERKLETPPPSLRSTISEQNIHDMDDVDSLDTKHKHNECRKKRNHKTTRVYVNSHLPSYPSMKKPKESKLNTMRESRAALLNKNEYKMKDTIDLNPVVRTYVNKLLSLNKESLKAIEVVKQDCSSISTPGSSIIDLPNNFERNNSKMQKKISLEQIKEDIIRQLVDKINDKAAKDRYADKENSRKYKINSNKSAIKISKKKQVHKVKSIKIPKKLVKKPMNSPQIKKSPKKVVINSLHKNPFNKNTICCNMETAKPTKLTDKELSTLHLKKHKSHNFKNIRGDGPNINKHFASAVSSYTNLTPAVKHYENMCNELTDSRSVIPVHISTQTSDVSDKEINFIKVAESKLQNMEKIANLTEKCTMRLSNLAKVLDEVRKNKSAAYSQISTPDPNSDYEIDKDIETVDHKISFPPSETENNANYGAVPIINTSYEGNKMSHNISLINDISNPQSKSSDQDSTPENHAAFNVEQICNKIKGKPPPALVKSKLKDCQEIIIPHELSTVIEVDSPISAKLKSRSPHTEDISTYNDKSKDKHAVKSFTNDNKIRLKDNKTNPDILENEKGIQKNSLNHSKAQMIDLNQFNKIMLQPFISINDYAKEYKMVSVDEASTIDDVGKNDAIADDISSLHSEGSLPDVVSELLKRNIIAEPFKFDSGNSTTISTDTTLSMLAISKHKKDQKKAVIRFENKENLCDTSDTLSVSSNPDLEHAFKKIGMGWASSTLKRTKERLALSSSSNTSSSSITHFKIKNNKDVPALVTDSLTSALKYSGNKNLDRSKTIEQQTSFSNSMTVKEFLTNELAKRITFANTSNKTEGDEEFISLYETKMPEEMKRCVPPRADHSSDQSQNNGNRARTSTPVQLFKSMTYHSSTNSNTSNGLFSNVDELSSVKGSHRNQSTSDQDNLTIPNLSLKTKKNSDCSKSE